VCTGAVDSPDLVIDIVFVLGSECERENEFNGQEVDWVGANVELEGRG